MSKLTFIAQLALVGFVRMVLLRVSLPFPQACVKGPEAWIKLLCHGIATQYIESPTVTRARPKNSDYVLCAAFLSFNCSLSDRKKTKESDMNP